MLGAYTCNNSIGGVTLKPFAKAAFAAVLVVVIALIVQRYYAHEKLTDHLAVNEGVAVTKEFSVQSHTPNQHTSATGTIIVWGDKGIAERMRMVVSFEIDPQDFGGMTVYIPKKWYISDLLSSYPENQRTPLQPRASASDMSLGDEWRNKVEVGVTGLQKPSGGGSGTIIIDLAADRQAVSPSETFNILVSVGSDAKGGVRSIGVDAIKIPISVGAGS